MRYFFESGVFFDISLAELSLVFESFGISKDSIKRFNENILLVESNSVTQEQLSCIFQRLGGYIRYGEVVSDLNTFLNPYFEYKKVTYGISVLGKSPLQIKDVQRLANEIKRGFKSSNVSTRFILPKRLELNAAQIVNNDVLEKGFELCIFDNANERLYGRTVAIQDVESFVNRDLNKPEADFDMGVLPQKLARIMCNLTGYKEGIIWDPFCGSGTVLMEAAVLGFDILGTDIDLGALEIADKNIRWLSSENLINDIKYNLFQLDIHNVEKRVIKDLKNTNISAIVCEPFMGPAQTKVMSESKANELMDSVRSLYVSFFDTVNKISRRGFKVVLILPSYKTTKGWLSINISEFIGKRWSVLNKQYAKGDLKWARINSIIARNIFILEKK